MALTVTRPVQPATLATSLREERVIEIDVRDHDGTFLVTRSARIWDCAGTAATNIATSPRTVRLGDDGRPFVLLSYAELNGMRARNEAYYWLGVN